MNVKVSERIEKTLHITEYDYINNEEILVLTIMGIRDNGGIWEFPNPQFWGKGEEIYNRNREAYDAQILAFRNDCENLTEEKGSVYSNQITSLKQDTEMIMLALAELTEMLMGQDFLKE